MSDHELTGASLWDQQTQIARAAAPYLAGYVAATTALYSATDIFYPDAGGLYFLTAMVGWVLGIR